MRSRPDRRAVKYTIRAPFRGSVAGGDREVSLVRVPTVCGSLAAGQSRQERSEYRAHRETDAKHPRNTDPGGKYGIQGRRGIDPANTTELVIPILWGKNTDPTGKGAAYDRRRCAIYGGPWCTKYPLA